MNRTLLRAAAGLLVAGGWLTVTPRADANWFGLFHTRHEAAYTPVCCGQPAVRAYVAPPPIVAAPAPVVAAASPCTTCNAPASVQVPETCMQTRCYQVPVTRYETRTNYQLVTENHVSEVMEPITTLQTSAYFDPCGCGYHNVTTPVTTMVRKQVVTPVQRTVAQHYVVPVTEYVQKCEQVPVTTMRTYYPAPPVAAAIVAPAPTAVAAVPTAPQLQAVPAAPAGAPPQQGPPQQIALPNAGTAAAVQQQDPNAGRISYPPANVNPDRKELVERTFRKGELVEEHRKVLEPTELQPVPNTSGAPMLPRTPANANGSSYAIPQEQRPLPRGVKTASYVPPYTGGITLSKPYY